MKKEVDAKDIIIMVGCVGSIVIITGGIIKINHLQKSVKQLESEVKAQNIILDSITTKVENGNRYLVAGNNLMKKMIGDKFK